MLLWYVRTAFFAALRTLSLGLNSKQALPWFCFAHIKQQIVSLFRSDQFMPTKSVDDQVTRAETLFRNFVAEHNLPFTISDHKKPFTDKLSFRVLSKLAKACCVIPVSNADRERIISMLKKYKLI
jgi:hypothetical protein